MSERLKILLLSCVEYVYLVVLWMAFVSKIDKTEFKVGLAIALVGTVADAIVKAEGMGHFRPHGRWMLLSFLEPWYVLKGTWTVIRFFPAVLRSDGKARFRAVEIDAGEDDVESGTRRALAATLLTIPPDTVIIGIDGETGRMLQHEIKPEPPSLMARELGVQE